MKNLLRISIFVLFISTMFGCSSSPAPVAVLNTDIKIIDPEELDDYWIPEIRRNISYPPERYMPPQGVKGYVKVKYIIDSNGNIFNAEVVESEPEKVFDGLALISLSNKKFSPAEKNKNRMPVKVVTKMRFNIR
ncbi:TonB family protein [Microbulbifer halophilus]|uniref:TonB family protein n=1 Tax=Microbulbifer halophilus TaxID=453963 RepID=A0ABW5ECH1_9GAMM|nr:TonB family protein [Microbulbifer halophilus]MCW8126410.1 TonB family protein [Microbulbifer halophilus]